ncbi:MAG: glutathione S-transferase family protein [Cyanobacteria bacterium J06600_6]
MNTTTSKNKPKLIAIAISHYCEKARWAMDYLEIDYLEEDHAPPFHRQYTSQHGGTSVPVLITENKAFTDSRDILHYLDRISQDKKLYPEDSELRNQVEAFEKLFDEKLGVAARTVGYYYAIQQPLKIAIAWGLKAPIIEKIKAILIFPKIPQKLKQLYKINSDTKNAAMQDIKEVFAVVDRELAAGQKYLVGDRITAGDLTFAALAAPILRPPNHPFYDSRLSKLSPERATSIAELRATPAGQLALRLYRENRK